MYHDYNFKAVLAASLRGAWQLDDVIPPGATLDFGKPFLPEALARTAGLGLDADERRLLNQIRGHEYLALFGLVEEFILPFILDHARPHLAGDDWRVRALLNFASEEAKHIHLFRRFSETFAQGFGTRCDVIGPASAIGQEVLRHDPLAVALLVLQIEWMTQAHYLDSVRDDAEIDPLFKSLLKHHWIEEAQHAKLDTLMVEALAEGRDAAGIAAAVEGYLELGAFFDGGLKAQTAMNLDAFERASGRPLGARRAAIERQQHQALRWTYLGSGMAHPNFVATLTKLSPEARDRVAAVAPTFA